MNQDYYVYAHVRLDKNTIFYVGKGRTKRFKKTERNDRWKKIANKGGYSTTFLGRDLNEEQAFRLEIEWIAKLKGINQCEANYSKGGEGCSGYKWTDPQRQRHSKRLKSRTPAMIDGQKNRVNKIKGRTKETHPGIKVISEKNKGEGNGRAIWNVLTPNRIFYTIKQAAEFYNISSAAVHKRIKSTSIRYKDWKKILK